YLRPLLPQPLVVFLKQRISGVKESSPAEIRIEPAVLFYVEWIGSTLSLMFDVGAHTGQFARSAMHVLPEHVKMVLFEADPRRADILNALKAAHSRIIQFVSKAVYHTSGQTIKFLQCPGEASHMIS